MDQPNELELEFRALTELIGKDIDAKVMQARIALSEAVELSEKYGIPFRTSVSPLGQQYHPNSYNDRFSKLNPKFVEELLGIDASYLGDSGWERSAVC